MSLELAKERICQLEDAIRRLDSVQIHLTKNASEICKEIQGSINFGIDCLQNRKLHLLKEVDNVRLTKEESLQQQQARLKQAVNILLTAVTLVTENPASEKHLADTLDRLTQLELSPEETPYISFRVDHLQTREHLLSYGRVDANGLPLANAFEDPDKPSASLPRHLEEYDDCDHHVFYKTLQEIKKPDISTSIKVNIPRLSQRTEDWLLKNESIKSHVKRLNNPIRPSTLKAQNATNGSTSPLSGSQYEDSGNSCSLNNWLSQIKHHSDLEEEHNFEIVDNTYKGKASSPDLQKWLKPVGASISPYSTNIFGHINKDSKNWLMNVYSQLASVESNVVKEEKNDMFEHISREPSSWLRSRASRHSSLSDGQDFFGHISKDRTQWLSSGGLNLKRKFEESANKKEDGTPPVKNKWLRDPNHIPDLTSAMTSSLTSALTSSMTSSMSLESASCQPVNPWLKSTASNPSSGSSPNKSASCPLLQSQSVMSINDKNSPTDDLDWLSKDLSNTSITPTNTVKDGVKNNETSGLWLLTDYTSKKRNSISKLSSTQDLSDWLLVPRSSPSVDLHSMDESVAPGNRERSDSWSVYSEPQSVSTDQFAKDVAVAKEYFNQWLL